MRKPLIAGNWKMNTTVGEAIDLVKTMLIDLNQISNVETVVCPPFLSLTEIKKLLKATSVSLGAQNMYYMDKGAYTGEIAPPMLAGLCSYVILGHSERRQYFCETDEIINKKVLAALNIGLNPIFCVGESLKDNEAGNTAAIISNQVTTGLTGVKPTSRLTVAYEPIWAIGTGKAATAKQANATISLIRNILKDIWSNEIAQQVRILYGGSVNGNNITELISESEIDGALVGGASLKADDFLAIVRKTSKTKTV